MDSKLFDAILSMDSYNRGYNAGIVFGTDPTNSTAVAGVTQIGDATVYRTDGDAPAQTDGFYAIAYQFASGQTTIAYRGTDQFFGIPVNFNGIGGDIPNGWYGGSGLPQTPESSLAFEFYNAVASGTTNPITLTGHSLGGGLAGLVGEIKNVQSAVFDSMNYASAA